MGGHQHESNIIQVLLNDTSYNCSLYTLNNGHLEFFNSFHPDGQEAPDTVFPAYYITNCSDEVIRHYISSFTSNLNSDKIWDPRNASLNNGDAFVSLLFTISGTCCVCWMLCVFLVLSPSHKRKPILTQIATVFFTVVLTILLAKVTDTARDNYYTDVMDIAGVHDVFFNNLTYRITNVFSEFLISISFIQIVAKIARKKYRMWILTGTCILVIAYLVLSGICEGLFRYSTSRQIFTMGKSSYIHWHQAKNALKLAYVAVVGFVLLYYTTFVKSPRKYSHSKKLIPLAIFIWLLFIIHLTVSILLVASFFRDWANRSWLSILPNLLEIGILSLVWEWIYDIRSLERRNELMGVLGRRISVDDITIFQTHEAERSKERKENRNKVVGWIKRLFNRRNVYVESDSRPDTTSNSTKDGSTQDDSTGAITEHPADTVTILPTEEETGLVNNGNDRNDGNDNSGGGVDGGAHFDLDFDDEVIDNYDLYSDEETGEFAVPGSSSNHPTNNPPPFEPHPGFNSEDYWPEKTER